MIKNRLKGIFLLGSSLVFLSWNISITGFSIKNYSQSPFIYAHLIGIILLFVSFLLLTSKRTLDYLVIPTGWEEERIGRALKELDKRKVKKVLITGYVDKDKVKGSHRQKIYKALREYGLKPRNIEVMPGIDSEEDILYLGKKLKGRERIGFDTFPLHYQEYKELIKKAVKYGQFPKSIKIENIKTSEDLKQKIYGTFGWLEEFLKRRKLDYVKNKREEYLPKKIKEKVKKILR